MIDVDPRGRLADLTPESSSMAVLALVVAACSGAAAPRSTPVRALAPPPRAAVDPECAELDQVGDGLEAVRRVQGDAVVLRYGITFDRAPQVMQEVERTVRPRAGSGHGFVVTELEAVAGTNRKRVVMVSLADTETSFVARYVDSGSLSAFTTPGTELPLAVGDVIARRLGVRVGAIVRLESREGQEIPAPLVVRTARVVAVLRFPAPRSMETGNFVFASLDLARALANTDLSGVRIRFEDPAGAAAPIAELTTALTTADATFRVMTFREINAGLLDSLQSLRARCGR